MINIDIVATQTNKDINGLTIYFVSNLNNMKIKLNKYVWFGLQSFRQSAGNPGSPQGSPSIEVMKTMKHSMVIRDSSSWVPTSRERRKLLR